MRRWSLSLRQMLMIWSLDKKNYGKRKKKFNSEGETFRTYWSAYCIHYYVCSRRMSLQRERWRLWQGFLFIIHSGRIWYRFFKKGEGSLSYRLRKYQIQIYGCTKSRCKFLESLFQPTHKENWRKFQTSS